METFLLLLLFPLAWPFVAKRIWHHTINWTEMVIQMVLVSLLVTVVYQCGKFGQTSDTEIWNGYVQSKDRVHDHYVESYSCNCTTTCSGSGSNQSCTETCQTCYEDHYTVKWWAKTTVGNVTFEYLDRTTKRVYKEPDPASYVRCKVGEPASIVHSYTNYVQAVPQSLFNDDSAIDTYAAMVPAYPRVYDHYRINRVLNVGSSIDAKTISGINEALNISLKTLGNQKQVNVVVILTSITDPSYRYAVERKWLGGEKNDVIVLVGLDGTEVIWTDVITWALNKGNELFHVKLRDSILDMKTFDADKFTGVVIGAISAHYDRPEMKDFEYLKSAIEPPTWVLILSIIISIGGSLGLSVVFHYKEVDDIIGYSLKRKFSKKRF